MRGRGGLWPPGAGGGGRGPGRGPGFRGRVRGRVRAWRRFTGVGFSDSRARYTGSKSAMRLFIVRLT